MQFVSGLSCADFSGSVCGVCYEFKLGTFLGFDLWSLLRVPSVLMLRDPAVPRSQARSVESVTAQAVQV